MLTNNVNIDNNDPDIAIIINDKAPIITCPSCRVKGSNYIQLYLQ